MKSFVSKSGCFCMTNETDCVVVLGIEQDVFLIDVSVLVLMFERLLMDFVLC